MHILYPYNKQLGKSDLIIIDKRVRSGIFYNETIPIEVLLEDLKKIEL